MKKNEIYALFCCPESKIGNPYSLLISDNRLEEALYRSNIVNLSKRFFTLSKETQTSFKRLYSWV